MNPLTTECAMCGRTFTARRTTAKFCSPACRTAWGRRGDKVRNEIDTIKASLLNIERFVERWPDLKESTESALVGILHAGQSPSDVESQIEAMLTDIEKHGRSSAFYELINRVGRRMAHVLVLFR